MENENKIRECEDFEYLEVIFDNKNLDFYKGAKVIEFEKALYLQSYETIVAKIENGNVTVYGWYSITTARHINEFLQQNGFNIADL